MRLLLDTHVLLWWHDQPVRLTETAHNAITDLGNDVFLSVVNGWEIQLKAQLGKLTLPKPLRVLLQEEEATNGFRYCLSPWSMSIPWTAFPAPQGYLRPPPYRPSLPGRFGPGDARSEVLGVLRPCALVGGMPALAALLEPIRRVTGVGPFLRKSR